MQTFLPLRCFFDTARVLDRQRLGKQRVEVLQILNILTGARQGGGWIHHPAVRMWRGHEHTLALYGTAICGEWIRRGYKDTCMDKICARAHPDIADAPEWLDDPRLHSSHRSMLLYKDPVWYGQFGWTDPPGTVDANGRMSYFWPV